MAIQYDQLDILRKNSNGMLKLAEAMKSGISKPTFYEYIKARELYKAAPGIYLAEDDWQDSMYLFHLRFRQAIFSHEAALFLHDLAEREPDQYAVTVVTGYNPSKMKELGLQVYTIKQDLHQVGLSSLSTPFGNQVPVYNMERTICDILRSRNRLEIQTIQVALKQYVLRRDKNLQQLMRYAKLFRVETVLRRYLEVLL